MVRWWFEDRATGRLVVAQFPNAALWCWVVLTAVRVVARPSGAVAQVVSWGATATLCWWAGDEVIRGVNPFRRVLGAVVGAVTVAGVLARVR